MPTLWSLIFTRRDPSPDTVSTHQTASILLRLISLEQRVMSLQSEQRRSLNEIRTALKRAEENQMATNPVIQRLVDEVEQTRGAVASAAVFIRSVPDLIRQAVTDALATNPGADLSNLEGLAESLDAAQAELTSAMQANLNIADEGEETVVTEAKEVEPEDTASEPFPEPTDGENQAG